MLVKNFKKNSGAGIVFAIALVVLCGMLIFTAVHMFSSRQGLRDTFVSASRLDALYIAESSITETFQKVLKEMNDPSTSLYKTIRQSTSRTKLSFKEDPIKYSNALCHRIEASISMNAYYKRIGDYTKKNGDPLPDSSTAYTPGTGPFEGVGYVEVNVEVSFGKKSVFGTSSHSVSLKQRRDIRITNTRYSKLLDFGFYSRFATEQFKYDWWYSRFLNDYNKGIQLTGDGNVLFGNGDNAEGFLLLDMPPGEFSDKLKNASSKRYYPKTSMPKDKITKKTWETWCTAAHNAKSDIFQIKMQVKAGHKKKWITKDGWPKVKEFNPTPGKVQLDKFTGQIVSGGGWGITKISYPGFMDEIHGLKDAGDKYLNSHTTKYFYETYTGHLNWLRNIKDGESGGGKPTYLRSHYLYPRDKAISIGKNQKKLPLDLEWNNSNVKIYGRAYARSLVYSSIYWDYKLGDSKFELFYAFPVLHDAYQLTENGKQFTDQMVNLPFIRNQYTTNFIKNCEENCSTTIEADLNASHQLPFKFETPANTEMVPGKNDLWELELGFGITGNKISYFYNIDNDDEYERFRSRHVNEKDKILYINGIINLETEGKPGKWENGFTFEDIEQYKGQGVIKCKGFKIDKKLTAVDNNSFLIVYAANRTGNSIITVGNKEIQAALVSINGLGKGVAGREGLLALNASQSPCISNIKGCVLISKMKFIQNNDFYSQTYKLKIDYDKDKLYNKGNELSSATGAVAKRAFLFEDLSH